MASAKDAQAPSGGGGGGAAVASAVLAASDLDLTLVLTAVLGFCLVFYALVSHARSRRGGSSSGFGAGARRVLLVTAHPDDETMFFGPTVVGLRRQHEQMVQQQQQQQPEPEVMLLCLSAGDYGQQGRERKEELYRACEVLGIKEENITLLKYDFQDDTCFDISKTTRLLSSRYTRLRDDPSVRWREELVSEVVLQAVVANSVDTVVTFDRGGVSGHKNHTSIHNALTLLCLEKK